MNQELHRLKSFAFNYTLNIGQIASVLSKSKAEVKAKLLSGEIKSVKRRNQLLSSKQWIEDYIRENKIDLRISERDFAPKPDVAKQQNLTPEENCKRLLSSYGDVLSIGEVAIAFGVDSETVRRRTASGKIKCVRYKRKCLIPKMWLFEYLQEHDFEICGIYRNKRYEEKQRALMMDVIDFCATPKSYKDLLEFTGYKQKSYLQLVVTRPLLKMGSLRLTIPESPHDNRQQYVATGKPYI